jgi:sugar-specific transcriptional regulator TrmB
VNKLVDKKELDKVLEKLGFSEYKKKAYISLMNLNIATNSDISEDSGIPTSKSYEIMNWLYKNGYISIINDKPLTYKINNPKSILKSEVLSRIDKLKEIEENINSLNFLVNNESKDNFEIIQGRNSFFKKVKETVLKSNNNIVAFVKNWRLDYELTQLNIEFIKRGGTIKFMGPINSETQYLVDEWKKQGALVKNYKPNSTRFTVWDNRYITIGFKEEKDYFSLWIDNEFLANILVDYFNSEWDQN